MKFQTNITIATCTALSTISNNYTPNTPYTPITLITQGLLPGMLLKLIIIIIIIFIIIVLLSRISEWWAKRGVKEISPQFPQYLTGGGNDFWALLEEKIKRLFGKT